MISLLGPCLFGPASLAAAALFAGLSVAQLEAPAAPHDSGRATSHRTFEDVEYWIRVFDDPKRDAWQKPHEVIAALGLKDGHFVADLGAGTGYFMTHLAAAVGASGALYAVEVEPNLVAHLRLRAEQAGLRQVVPVLASKDHPRLPPGSLDAVVIVDTFHHLDHRGDYLHQLAGTLKPLGRVAVIDWRMGELPEGPPPDHKLPPEQVVREFTAAGFELMESPEFLPYQYFLIFRRNPGALPGAATSSDVQ